MRLALFYKKLKNKIVQCQLCPHFCTLKNGEMGKCKVRKNINGTLYPLSYGHPVSINIDPIMKKPLYHYLQNTATFSIGMPGCNLKCSHCQNWEISQRGPEEIPTPEIKVDEIIKIALESKCPSISYTYTEPFVSYEYVYDIAKSAKKYGFKNIVVTNGFINPGPLKKISPYIDAMNIDLKSFSDALYKKYCGAKLQPVLDTIKRAHKKGIWIEITTLIIPGLNDSEKELEQIAKFIADIDKNIPWHISRFFPNYKMTDKPVTPIKTLEKAHKIGKKYLKYVYVGNV